MHYIVTPKKEQEEKNEGEEKKEKGRRRRMKGRRRSRGKRRRKGKAGEGEVESGEEEGERSLGRRPTKYACSCLHASC
jgi:hypothetical protein